MVLPVEDLGPNGGAVDFADVAESWGPQKRSSALKRAFRGLLGKRKR
jgi:hypothetical protein